LWGAWTSRRKSGKQTRKLKTRRQIEFSKQGAQMGFDRGLADIEPVSDLFVTRGFDNQRSYLPLPRTESVEAHSYLGRKLSISVRGYHFVDQLGNDLPSGPKLTANNRLDRFLEQSAAYTVTAVSLGAGS
jgi:hypothetical protein